MSTANPSIIIGLGGTGQWVLTYLKRNLIETYRSVPDTVKLIAFDTTSDKSEARVAEETREERAQVDDITLADGEFVYLGGNIQKICQEIDKDGLHPHISSWLQAKWYLQAVDPNAYDISGGAGQRRQFGRMAVFYDLSTGRRQLIAKIDTAMKAVKAANKRAQPVEIFVVTSIAGGTGSGMFVDIAHLVRQIAIQNQIKDIAIRGFIVLQNTFSPVINVQNVLPNVFGAMRELDRFMLVFDRDYPIYYSEKPTPPQAIFHGVYNNKLFDNCYLLDAQRKESPLNNVAPKYGVYPCVAECLTAMIDGETSNTFQQHYKNVNQHIAQRQADSTAREGEALFSSIGAYTYVLPVEDIIRRNTLKAMREALSARFILLKENSNGVRSGDSQGNKELAESPRDHAMDFMMRQSASGDKQPILFLEQVARVFGTGAMNNPKFVSEIANLGTELIAWLTPPDKDPVMNEVSGSISAALALSIPGEVLTSKAYKDDTNYGADRILRVIGELRDKNLGRLEADNSRSGGRLQEGLAEYQKRNLVQFRGLLTEKLKSLLNGSASDMEKARGGKLPYAQQFLFWLGQSLDEFRQFALVVLKERQRQSNMAEARETAIRTREIMQSTKGLTGLMDRMRGTAHHAQEQHIQAEADLFDQERQELLYQSLVRLCQEVQNVVQGTKAVIDRWMQVLTVGEGTEGGEPGTLVMTEKEQVSLHDQREGRKQISIYQYITDDRYEDDLYAQAIQERWGEVIGKFQWGVVNLGAGIVVELAFGGKPLTLNATRSESASTINFNQLREGFSSYFAELREQRVIDRMAERFGPGALAVQMLTHASPLIDFAANEQAHAESRNLVCVNVTNQTGFVGQLEQGLLSNSESAKTNQVIGLSNRHRCIVLSTVDAITLQHTTPYYTARAAYGDLTGDRRLIHCFPAEVNASYYEKRVTQSPLREREHFLSPLLVSLLEDREMVRRFALAHAFGMIREEQSQGDNATRNQFVLRFSPRNDRDYNARIALTMPANVSDFVLAMTSFVYPRINRDDGKRLIVDPTNSSDSVEPEWLDNELERRRDALRYGREPIITQLEKRLLEAQSMDRERAMAFVALARVFVQQNDRAIRNRLDLTTNIEAFCRKNRNIVREANVLESARLLSESIHAVTDTGSDRTPGMQPLAAEPDHYEVIRHLENYIARLDEQRVDTERPRLERDLAALMEVVVLDEVQRLERL